MNYTSKHHLPQWAKSDRIMMDDFNAAMANIESALTAAAAATPYVTGTYTGAEADLTVTLGFRPTYLIINGIREGNSAPATQYFGATSCAVGRNHNLPHCLEFTDTGFTVKEAGTYIPDLVQKGRKYEYIAFK